MTASHDEGTDRWVARLNRLAREMDDAAASLHPSAWPEALGPQRTEFRRIAAPQPPESR